jgi:hypothetical protein
MKYFDFLSGKDEFFDRGQTSWSSFTNVIGEFSNLNHQAARAVCNLPQILFSEILDDLSRTPGS